MITDIAQLVILGLTIVMTILSLIVSLLKGTKKSTSQLYDMAMSLIAESEKIFENGNGNQKLTFVVRQLQMFFPKISEVNLTALVNNIVDLTKKVNSKEREDKASGVRISSN